MVRVITIAMAALLCLSYASAYTLIDSETFETYTNWVQGSSPSSFLNEALGVWNCTNTYTLNGCAKCAAGGCAGTGNFSIQNTGVNNYLSVYALGITYATPAFYGVSLDWKKENSTTFSSQNTSTDYILRYNLKLVSADSIAGGGGNTYRSHFAIDEGRSIGGINDFLTHALGGTNLATNDTFFKRVHSYRNSAYGVNWVTPANPITACDISDGAWHTVVATYRTNSTWALMNWSLFVDGNLCYNITGGGLRQYISSESFFTNNMRVWAQGGFWVDIDNISVWTAPASEEFLGIDTPAPQCDDGLDNDGDGLTDYGEDPRCVNVLDDSESPYDYTSTLCDEYSPPVYLQESFNGYIAGCGWFTTHNLLPAGSLFVNSTNSPYVQSKALSEDVTSTMSRYVTLQFDLNLRDIAANNYVDIRLYDVSYRNFWIFYIGGSPLTVYTTRDGVATNVTGISYNTSYTYKVIVDLQAKRYDAYLNTTQIANDYQFVDDLQAVSDVYFFKFASLQSSLYLDNIVVYSSDQNGAMLSPSSTVNPASNVTSMCGLFYKVTPSCTLDSDCATGDCMANNRCNSFRMKYCDEKGMVRGNKCIAGAIASCAFSSTAAVAFDNFLYVLIGLLFLVAITYFTIMFRRRGQ